jgi:hypothetical protein
MSGRENGQSSYQEQIEILAANYAVFAKRKIRVNS